MSTGDAPASRSHGCSARPGRSWSPPSAPSASRAGGARGQPVAERCAAHGAPDEALALYGRALRIQEAAFGPDSPALRPLLGDLAELELELGHDGDAVLHRARREMLEPRSAAPADRLRIDGVLLARTSDTPSGANRAN